MHADLYVQHGAGRWMLTSAAKPEDTIELASCDCRLKMADLYGKIEFSQLTLIRPLES